MSYQRPPVHLTTRERALLRRVNLRRRVLRLSIAQVAQALGMSYQGAWNVLREKPKRRPSRPLLYAFESWLNSHPLPRSRRAA